MTCPPQPSRRYSRPEEHVSLSYTRHIRTYLEDTRTMSLNGVAARIGPAGTGHDDRLAKDRGDSNERAEEERERREHCTRGSASASRLYKGLYVGFPRNMTARLVSSDAPRGGLCVVVVPGRTR